MKSLYHIKQSIYFWSIFLWGGGSSSYILVRYRRRPPCFLASRTRVKRVVKRRRDGMKQADLDIYPHLIARSFQISSSCDADDADDREEDGYGVFMMTLYQLPIFQVFEVEGFQSEGSIVSYSTSCSPLLSILPFLFLLL